MTAWVENPHLKPKGGGSLFRSACIRRPSRKAFATRRFAERGGSRLRATARKALQNVDSAVSLIRLRDVYGFPTVRGTPRHLKVVPHVATPNQSTA